MSKPACLVAVTAVVVLAGRVPPRGSARGGDGRGDPWPRHIIDDSSRGADGVRLADVNGDGLADIVTGWEEGGTTRVYVHPGYEAVRRAWPAVSVGRTPNVEDAVLVDLDGDGATDVVSSCEGGTRTIFFHWAPASRADYLRPGAWRTEPLPASQGRMMWMFCLPLEVDGVGGIDLVAAGKGSDCQIGWFQAPAAPRNAAGWRWHPLSPGGWIMSLRAVDMDGDDDRDVLLSDRKGSWRGCRWLENPGAARAGGGPWRNHFLGGGDHEVMFLAVADLDRDGTSDILAATRDDGLLWLRRSQRAFGSWQTQGIDMPAGVGTGKGVAVGDIDGDGRPDVVFSCENARGDRSGVVWLSWRGTPRERAWQAHEISGPAGIKFDRLELVDLDGDRDLDVLACEESHPVAGRRHGLGVFWYENPR